MKLPKTFLACLLVFVSLAPAIPASSEYDRFPKITLSGDKQHYRIGDEIKFAIDFHYDGGHKMRIFKDLAKSGYLTVGEWRGQEFVRYLNQPTHELLFKSRKDELWKNEPFDEFDSNASQMIRREITGRVKQEGAKIMVEFDGFGSFELAEPKTLRVSMFFLPVKPHPLSSLEY